jgi:hypothetical protein
MDCGEARTVTKQIANTHGVTRLPIAGLLAPVPLVHLADGQDVCRDEGKVAFGTRGWEVFRDLEADGGLGAPVLIYASHAAEHNLGPVVSWQACYAGWVPATISGGHPDGERYRPPSTYGGEDTTRHWLGFWAVTDLQALGAEEHIPIADLHDRRGRKFGGDFVPEGPILLGGLRASPVDR